MILLPLLAVLFTGTPTTPTTTTTKSSVVLKAAKNDPKAKQHLTRDQWRAKFIQSLDTNPLFQKMEEKDGLKINNVFFSLSTDKDDNEDTIIVNVGNDDGQMAVIYAREGDTDWHKIGPFFIGIDMMMHLEKVEISVPDAGVDNTKK